MLDIDSNVTHSVLLNLLQGHLHDVKSQDCLWRRRVRGA